MHLKYHILPYNHTVGSCPLLYFIFSVNTKSSPVEYITHASVYSQLLVIMAPIPDPPCGMRFCRKCNEFLPISEFYPGQRRYQCRSHTVSVRDPKVRVKRLSDPPKRAVCQIWQNSWEDSAILMEKKRIDITQAKVRKMFHDRGIEPTLKHRIVPLNPRALLTSENAKIVSTEERKALMACWRALRRQPQPS